MYICIYIYIYIHVYIYKYIYIYIHMCSPDKAKGRPTGWFILKGKLWEGIYTYIYIYIYVCMYMHLLKTFFVSILFQSPWERHRVLMVVWYRTLALLLSSCNIIVCSYSNRMGSLIPLQSNATLTSEVAAQVWPRALDTDETN